MSDIYIGRRDVPDLSTYSHGHFTMDVAIVASNALDAGANDIKQMVNDHAESVYDLVKGLRSMSQYCADKAGEIQACLDMIIKTYDETLDVSKYDEDTALIPAEATDKDVLKDEIWKASYLLLKHGFALAVQHRKGNVHRSVDRPNHEMDIQIAKAAAALTFRRI